jgi:glycerol-3-phosphate dehydrogenase (NAD(P)+)
MVEHNDDENTAQVPLPLLTVAAVLGGGSFGTVLANMLAENGIPTRLWMRDADKAAETQLTRENRHYMPGLALHPGLVAEADMARALDGADLVLLSVPSKAFRDVARLARPAMAEGAVVVCTAKGIETGTFKPMSQIIVEELPGHPYGVISGPNLALEIARRQLTGTVIASADPQVCVLVKNALHTSYFRLYSNTDIYGVELGGILKNIYAILAGIASSLGVGQNTMSLLMTRSIAEMSRFAASMGANPMTFIGLAGMGDLIVTCTSPLSRNFRIGVAIGQGKTLEQAISEVGQTAEGINTLKLVKERADEKNIYMPLASGLYRILFGGSTIEQELQYLTGSALNSDVEFVTARK